MAPAVGIGSLVHSVDFKQLNLAANAPDTCLCNNM